MNMKRRPRYPNISEELFPHLNDREIERYLKEHIKSQEEVWGDVPVFIALIGYSAQRDFGEIEEFYDKSSIRYRTMLLKQDDEVRNGMRKIITNPQDVDLERPCVVYVFDNRIVGGKSMAGALDFFLTHCGTEFDFDRLYLGTVKDGLNIAHYPLAVVEPCRYEDLDHFLFLYEALGRRLYELKEERGEEEFLGLLNRIAPAPPGREKLFKLIKRNKDTSEEEDISQLVCEARREIYRIFTRSKRVRV